MGKPSLGKWKIEPVTLTSIECREKNFKWLTMLPKKIVKFHYASLGQNFDGGYVQSKWYNHGLCFIFFPQNFKIFFAAHHLWFILVWLFDRIRDRRAFS